MSKEDCISPKGLRDKANSPWEGCEMSNRLYCSIFGNRTCTDRNKIDPHGMFEDVIFQIHESYTTWPRY